MKLRKMSEWRWRNSMGYRTEVRLITTKQGYSELKQYINENSENNHGLEDLLEDLDMKKKVKDLVVLGWDSLRGDGVEALNEITLDLYDKDISFRYFCLGENIQDIEESSHTSEKDRNKFIPYICITREFDDKYLTQELKQYAKEYEKQNSKDMEVE